MSILADHQIRSLCVDESGKPLPNAMILPFEEGSHRPGVVSWGCSSYGYDVRVGNRFKVVNGELRYSDILDPKRIDNRLFHDLTADYCIIPPNSFALAETVEYFEIPRNVLAVCLGKSTYARCFTGDTRVALVDGTNPTFEELLCRHNAGETLWGYSINKCGDIIASLIESPRVVGKECVVEVELDNKEVIRCTPDHKFMTRHGEFVDAGKLQPGDSLMPLYRYDCRGYEMTYNPGSGQLVGTHRMSDEWNLRHGIYQELPGAHRHHIDKNKRNNRPCNIMRMEASEHVRLHNSEYYGDDFDGDAHGDLVREAIKELSKNQEWAAAFSASQSEKARKFWHADECAEARRKLIEKMNCVSEETREKHRQAMVDRFKDIAAREHHSKAMKRIWENGTERKIKQAAIARGINCREEITADVVRQAFIEAGTIRGAAKILGCDRSVFRRFPNILEEFRGKGKQMNHKVLSVKPSPGVHDVYCLTAPEAGNFALGAGVFVNNCGIIINVTPLEPEWRGRVTIEISNTTPLPAAVYANEGIAQIIFHLADDVCRTSYADKKGKYQDQAGLTLPIVDGERTCERQP